MSLFTNMTQSLILLNPDRQNVCVSGHTFSSDVRVRGPVCVYFEAVPRPRIVHFLEIQEWNFAHGVFVGSVIYFLAKKAGLYLKKLLGEAFKSLACYIL